MFKPINFIDVIALVIIILAVALKWCGKDGDVSMILIMVVAYYFGKKTSVLPSVNNNK